MPPKQQGGGALNLLTALGPLINLGKSAFGGEAGTTTVYNEEDAKWLQKKEEEEQIAKRGRLAAVDKPKPETPQTYLDRSKPAAIDYVRNYAQFQAELHKTKNYLNEAEVLNTNLSSDLDATNEKLAQERVSRNDLSKQLNQTKEELEGIRAALAESEEKLSTPPPTSVNSKSDEQELKILQLESDLAHLQKRYDRVAENLEQIKASCQEPQEDVPTEELAALNNELGVLQQQLKRLNDENQNLSDTLDEEREARESTDAQEALKAHLADAEEEKKTLTNWAKQLEKELSEIKKTNSRERPASTEAARIVLVPPPEIRTGLSEKPNVFSSPTELDQPYYTPNTLA
jgi:predicted  nucleic acid-binding Zn-ribbon protein